MTTQSQIDREQDINAILFILVSYGLNVSWCREKIINLTRIEDKRIDRALQLLTDRSLVTCVRGQYKPSDEGIALAEAIAKNSKIKISITEWKTEVLTGITSKGDRSKIERAAIPSPQQMIYQEASTPEEIYAEYEERKRISTQLCKRWGITPRQYDQAVIEGRIRVCRGIRGVSHVGIFDRRGNGWQTYCRECSKENKRQYKKKMGPSR